MPQPRRPVREASDMLRPPIVGDDGVNPFADPQAAPSEEPADRSGNVFASPTSEDDEPVYTPEYVAALPHRGTMVRWLGVISAAVSVLFAAFFFRLGLAAVGSLAFSIGAIIIGCLDLRAMNAGAMDDAGRGATKLGALLGLGGAVLSVAAIVMFIVWQMYGLPGSY